MGIPRLTSDLKQYGEQIRLGLNLGSDAIPHIDNVVIDGPSMVYHLLQKVQTYKSQLPDRRMFSILPTYTELNTATKVFTDVLEQHGVKVRAVIFDGALPLDKRPTRLERLEDVRRQLEVGKSLSPRLDESKPQHHDLDTSEIKTALWTSGASSKGTLLPAPPLIVPSIIEFLKSTKYAAITKVVPGEADAFCASAANTSKSTTAILSADSDLLMYEDAQSRTIVPFSTLALAIVKTNSGSDARCISAEGWTPSSIAQRLGVPRLQYFGFQRSRDGAASTSEIIQRSKSAPPDDWVAQWESFAKQYASRPLDLYHSIEYLDPRLAELVPQFEQSDAELHMYLPPLLEDPSRDASWNYGRDIRAIAYTLLAAQTRPLNSKHVSEYHRSGQRVSTTRVPLLSGSELGKKVHLFSQNATVTPEEPRWFAFHVRALKYIAEFKREGGKPLDLLVLERLFGVSAATPRKVYHSSLDPGWTTQHLLANVQAVLYSLRMLKQVCARVMLGQVPDSVSPGSLQGVVDVLAPLPPIQGLFFSVSELGLKAQGLDRADVRACLRDVLAGSSEVIITPILAENSQVVRKEELEVVRRKKKKRKKGIGVKVQASNPFAALEGSDGSA